MASYNCIYALRLHITNLHTILKLFSLKQSPNYLAKFRKKNLFCRADFKKKNWKAYLNNFWTPPHPRLLRKQIQTSSLEFKIFYLSRSNTFLSVSSDATGHPSNTLHASLSPCHSHTKILSVLQS